MDDIRIWSAAIVSLASVVVCHCISSGVFTSKENPEHHSLSYAIGSVAWWEYPLLVVPPFLLCPLMALIGSWSATRDTEQWGSYVVKAEYYEDWDEYIHQTCVRTVSCGKDCTTTETYDCSYVLYHPPYWEITDSIDQTMRITKEQFDWLSSKYGNKKFVDLHRHYHTNDGDKYVASYNGRGPIERMVDDGKLVPIVTDHGYENRVAVAHSVFSYEEVSKEDVENYHLVDYHHCKDLFDDEAILNSTTVIHDNDLHEARKRISKWNSLLGPIKQVRMIVVLMPEDVGLKGAKLQEAKWQGGNKNEVVACIGIGKTRQPEWCHVFSWSEADSMKIRIRDAIANTSRREADSDCLVEFVDSMAKEVESSFVRKNFHDFDYLSVPCPTWAVVVTWILNVAVSFGVCHFVIHNDQRS